MMIIPLRSLATLSMLAASSAALAQSVAFAPLSEVIDQPVLVTTAGVQNTLYFAADGTLRIITPGQKSVPARWGMKGQTFCIDNGGQSECWPYKPFEARVPQTMTSSCDAQSTWLAQSTNSDARRFAGERGR